MVIVFTDFRGLCLASGLKDRLAQGFSARDIDAIPLHFCFQRQGLGFRSAIALQLATQDQSSPQVLAQQYLQNLIELPVLLGEKSWSFQAIATDQGWLEFFLTTPELGRWLNLLVTTLENAPSLATGERTAPPFAFQYLHARCHSLRSLAAQHYPQHLAQWRFAETGLPHWERDLLEAIARFGLAVAADEFQDRLLRKVAQAFWEFHRHCPLFYFLREEPCLGIHYLQWITLLEKLFFACFKQIYQVEAIAQL